MDGDSDPRPTRGPSAFARLGPPLLCLGLGVLWLVLTYWRPEATFHFVPLFIAVSWPYAARNSEGRRLDTAGAAIAVGGGLAVALLSTALLGMMGRLDGPTFWGPDGAALEAVAMAAIGALWGTRVVTRTRPGFLTP